MPRAGASDCAPTSHGTSRGHLPVGKDSEGTDSESEGDSEDSGTLALPVRDQRSLANSEATSESQA